jgi:predicted permease
MVGSSFDVAAPSGVVERAPGTTVITYILARLGPGQTPESASAALRAAQPQIREALLPSALALGWPDRDYLRRPLSVSAAASGQSAMRGRFERPLLAMLILAGLVLFIACVNVANLVLARAIARRHELSLRRALGGSRGRLARQVLVESLLVSGLGGALGLAFAGIFSRLLVRQVSTDTSPVFLDLSLDWRVVGFTALAAAGTALLFGLAPALRAANSEPSEAIKEGGRTRVGDRRWGLNQMLIVAQVAFSLVLVVAAGLLARTFSALATMDLGFDRAGVLIASLNAQDAQVPDFRRPQLYERVRAAVASVPGVAAATALRSAPVSPDHWVAHVRVIGQPPVTPRRLLDIGTMGPFLNAVSPDYFTTFGVPILVGRGFAEGDGPNAPLVAVVNESFARHLVGGRNPVGEVLDFGGGQTFSPRFQIIGLAKDAGSARYRQLRGTVPPTVYFCIGQMSPTITNFAPPAAFRIAARATQGPAGALTRNVADAIARVEPDLRVSFRTMAAYVDSTLMTERLAALLSGLFGSLALLLAAVGVFGVTSYTVGRRQAEIGLRIALGASPAGVVRTVVSRLVVLMAAGIVAGGAVSFWASRFVGALIFGLQPRDPTTFAGAALTLTAVVILAGWLPARRAAHIDPAVVLRNE